MSLLNLSWLPGNRGPLVLDKPSAPAPAPTLEQMAKLDAHVREKASQITFYPYDRGQCFDKNTLAVMAFVNVPGACAHYCWTSATKAWEFVQLPHMSTEQRCAERMGYMTIARMRKHLVDLFDKWLVKSGTKVVNFAGFQIRSGELCPSTRNVSLKDLLEVVDMRDMVSGLKANAGVGA